MIKFIFAWWDTPLYLWSIKTLVGMLCMPIVLLAPILITCAICEIIDSVKENHKNNK